MTIRTPRRRLSWCTTVAAICIASAERPVAAQPNLVVILADDLGYADVGFNGCRDIPTPHLDRIAQEGVRCTAGYVTYSVCGPSRAGLMTGRYQDRFGFCRNPTIDPTNPAAGIPLTETTLAEALHQTGYASMAVGKWHLGTHPTLQPLQRGFDEFFGFLSGGHDYFPENLTLNDLSEVKRPWDWYRTKLLRNDRRVKTTEYLTDELSAAAVDFVARRHRQPFFLYLAYNAPHAPLQATEKYLNRFSHMEDVKRRTYAAMVSAVDDGVGLLLDELDECGVTDNTVVFFLSDNGGPTKVNGSRNDPLRGGKGSPFEGGIRVPFAVRWPGTLPAGVDYDQPVSSLDIFATIAAHNKLPADVTAKLDGVDLTPHLAGRVSTPSHRSLQWRFYDAQTTVVRRGAEKLILDARDRRRLLFDLNEDVREERNLAANRQASASALQEALDKWTPQLQEPAFPGLNSWP